MRKPLVVGDHVVSVPVSTEVQAVIDTWANTHHEELKTALAHLDIGPVDILVPTYHRVVYADEVNPT